MFASRPHVTREIAGSRSKTGQNCSKLLKSRSKSRKLYATLSQDVLKCSSQHKIALNCTVRFVRFKEILRGCRLWSIYRNFPSDMGPRDQFHKIMLSQKFDAKRLKRHFLYSTHAPCTPPIGWIGEKNFFGQNCFFTQKWSNFLLCEDWRPAHKGMAGRALKNQGYPIRYTGIPIFNKV